MDITVLLGAPGSGKGTQAKRLSQKGGFVHFSTGDMLRAAIQERTEVGLKAKAYMDRGELVPDDIMIALIEEALKRTPPQARVLLDGFPRTVPQAEALDGKPSTQVTRALNFQVPESMLVQRLTGRRVCQKCGEPYHVENLPPRKEGVCDKCGGTLIQRSDDTPEVVKRRLEVFAGQNAKLLSYYRENGKLRDFDGNRPVDVLQQDLLRVLQ